MIASLTKPRPGLRVIESVCECGYTNIIKAASHYTNHVVVCQNCDHKYMERHD